MISTPKIEALVEKICEIIDEEAKKQNITTDEFFHVTSRFVAYSCKKLAQDSPSLEVLDNNEDKVIAFLAQFIGPYFEERWKIFLPQHSSYIAKHKGEKLLTQMKRMLVQYSVTPDEGLYLVGELASAVTLLNTPNVKAQYQVQEIERHILNHLKGKLSLALDTIRVQRGFVKKH